MKWLAPAMVLFALLTDPQGRLVYVMKQQVVIVRDAYPHENDEGCHTHITTLARDMCVAESPDDVRRKIEAQ